jgi:cation:H+ antiporter
VSVLEQIPPPITLAAGLFLLLFGGHWLVNGAVRIAQRFGVSTLLIGLTVVAFGTSSPELGFNIIAALSGNGDLSFGNVVGSNIANISLALGIGAILMPLTLNSRVLRRELPLAIFASIAMICLGWISIASTSADEPGLRMFDRIDGAVLLFCFLLCTVGWYLLAKNERADSLVTEASDEVPEPRDGALLIPSVQIVIGLALLLIGGKATETGAVGVATALGVAQSVIGLTIVAFATSLPEIVTTLFAVKRGHADLAVGNIIGSNLFNILLVLGATALCVPVPVPEPHGGTDMLIMLGLTLLLLPLAGLKQRRIVRWQGAVLLAIYAGYITFTVIR